MSSESRLRYKDQKHTSLAGTKIRPFTSSSQKKIIRSSFSKSQYENDDVDLQLKMIEARLERGSLNHLRNINEKAKAVKSSNEVVNRVNHQYRIRQKQEEEKNLKNYVRQYYDKHKKIQDNRHELKLRKDHERYSFASHLQNANNL